MATPRSQWRLLLLNIFCNFCGLFNFILISHLLGRLINRMASDSGAAWFCNTTEFSVWDNSRNAFAPCFEESVLLGALPLVILLIFSCIAARRKSALWALQSVSWRYGNNLKFISLIVRIFIGFAVLVLTFSALLPCDAIESLGLDCNILKYII